MPQVEYAHLFFGFLANLTPYSSKYFSCVSHCKYLRFFRYEESNRDGRKSRIKAQKKIKRTNSNLENLEQRNAAEHSGTKKSMPEDAQVSLAIMVKLCLRWRFSMDSKEIRDLVQAYVKANKKLEGAAGNHLRKYCRDRGWVSLFFWVLVSV